MAQAGSEALAAAAAATSADAGAGQTLLAKHAGSSKGVPKARVKKQSTVEAATQKAIKDNFRGWSALQTHETQIAGETLFTTILKDKQRNIDNPGSVVMGSQYYRSLKEKFCGTNSAYSQLAVLDPSEVVGDSLMQAMVALKTQNSQKALLLEYLTSSGPCNQKELVGILRSMCLLRPCASPAQLQLILECMRYITRNKLDASFPKEVILMHETFDGAMLCALKSFKKLNGDPEAWYQNYKDPATLPHAPQTSTTHNTTQHQQNIERSTMAQAHRLSCTKPECTEGRFQRQGLHSNSTLHPDMFKRIVASCTQVCYMICCVWCLVP
jgi:hypothetical protein